MSPKTTWQVGEQAQVLHHGEQVHLLEANHIPKFAITPSTLTKKLSSKTPWQVGEQAQVLPHGEQVHLPQVQVVKDALRLGVVAHAKFGFDRSSGLGGVRGQTDTQTHTQTHTHTHKHTRTHTGIKRPLIKFQSARTDPCGSNLNACKQKKTQTRTREMQRYTGFIGHTWTYRENAWTR